MLQRQSEPLSSRSAADVVKLVMWPIAVLTIIHRVVIKAVNRYVTDDFTPVYNAAVKFWNGRPVYEANFDWVDPHYLYPPSGTLLMAPLAVLDPERSRWLFIGVNAIAVIAAAYVLLKMFGLSPRSVAAPVLLFAMFATETVSNTLIFTNINGLVLLGEVLFMLFLLQRKDLWAGVPIGLTLAVKPILGVLLLIPLVNKQWRTFIGAIGIPLVLTAIAWPLSADPMEFVRHTLPYLLEARDYFNSAFVGQGLYYGVPSAIILIMRVVFGVFVLVSLWLLYRYYREDQLFFITTASGVLLTASFLLGSLGQMYYSMMLFPVLMTVVLRNSVVRNWPAWLAAYGFLSHDSWLSSRFKPTGEAFEYLRSTFGWALLIATIFVVLFTRYLRAREAGTLEYGIDPPQLHSSARAVPARIT